MPDYQDSPTDTGSSLASSSEREPLEQLAEEFLDRWRQGEDPQVSEYAKAHPKFAAEIRELFPALLMMEDARHAQEDPAPLVTAPPALQRLGDYQIIREIGRGGMGVVYEAEQESLGRRVALKVLPTQSLPDTRAQQRFRREARAAARLHHTNIVPVFGVGEDKGMHYFAMQFIDGLGLDKVLQELAEIRKVDPHTAALSPNDAFEDARQRSSEKLAGVTKRVITDPAGAAVVSRLNTGAASTVDRIPREPLNDISLQVSQAPHEPDGNAARPIQADPTVDDTAIAIDADTDTSGVSSSFTVGSETTGSHSSPTHDTNYWRRVARIGIQVAEALQYAHEHGVLHRDVKPGNLLLDVFGTVWVTDFGLARIENYDNVTQTGDIVGTIRYMAPEQFSGQVDQRCDIYALGLSLYEMLALRPAYDALGRNQLIQQVLHESPPRLRNLDSRIPRDLETIVNKAIDRDPKQRYSSAAELSEDLQRYLKHEPILARRPSLWLKLRKFSLRHRTLLWSIAAACVMVAGVTIGMLYHNNVQIRAEQKRTFEEQTRTREALDDANENFQLARQAVDEFMTRVTKELDGVPHLDRVRRALLRQALAYYEEFHTKRSNDADLQFEAAMAGVRAGRIYLQLDDHSRSRKTCDRAIQLLEQLTTTHADEVTYRIGLASAYRERGALNSHIGQLAASESDLLKSRRILEEIPDAKRGTEAYDAELGKTLLNTATLFKSTGRFDKAEVVYREAIAVHQRRVKRDDRMVEPHLDLLAARGNLASVAAARGRTHESIELLRSLKTESERLVKKHPDSLRANRNRVMLQMNLGADLWRGKRLEEAEQMLRQALPIARKLVSEHPGHMELLRVAAGCLMNLGGILIEADRQSEALPFMQQALEIVGQPARDYPHVPAYRSLLGAMQNNLAMAICKDPRRRNEAEELLRKAIENQKAALNTNPREPSYVQYLFNHYSNLTKLHVEDGRVEESLEWAMKFLVDRPREWDAVARLEELLGNRLTNISRYRDIAPSEKNRMIFEVLMGVESLLVARVRELEMTPAERSLLKQARDRALKNLKTIANRCRATGQVAQAIRALEARIRVLRSGANDSPKVRNDIAACFGDIAELHHHFGESNKAIPYYLKTIEAYDKLSREFPDTPMYQLNLAGTRGNYALLLGRLNRRDEARRLYSQTTAMYEQMLSQPDWLNSGKTRRLAKAQSDYGGALNNFAMQHIARHEYQKAKILLQRAIRYQSLAHQSAPNAATPREFLRNHYRHLAIVHAELNELKEARKNFDSALKLGGKLVQEKPEKTDHAESVADLQMQIAQMDAQRGRFDSAINRFRKAAGLYRKLAKSSTDEAAALLVSASNSLSKLGFAQLKAGRIVEAQKSTSAAIALLEDDIISDGRRQSRRAMEIRARSYQNAGVIANRLDRSPDAIRFAQNAITTYVTLVKNNPDDVELLDKLATAHVNLAAAFSNAAKSAGARLHAKQEEQDRKAVELMREVVKRDKNNPEYTADLGLALYNLGVTHYTKKQDHDAEKLLNEAVAAYLKAIARHPTESRHVYELARARRALAMVFKRRGDHAAAGKLLAESIKSLQQIVRRHPADPDYRVLLAGCFTSLGELAFASNPRRAADYAAETFKIYAELHRVAPGIQSYQREMARSLMNRAVALSKTKQPAETERAYRRSIEEFGKLLNDKPVSPRDAFAAGGAQYNLGLFLGERRRPEEAIAWLTKAAALFETAVLENPQNVEYREYLLSNFHHQHDIVTKFKTDDLRKDVYRRALKCYERLVGAKVVSPDVLRQRAIWTARVGADLVWRGSMRESIDYHLRAIGMFDELAKNPERRQENRKSQIEELMNLAIAYDRDSQFEKAESSLRQALQVSENNPDVRIQLAWFLTNCADKSIRNISDGLKLATQSRDEKPDVPRYWGVYGAALYRSKQFQEAIAAETKAIELAGEKATPYQWLFLAMAYQKSGNKAAAREWYDRAAKWFADQEDELRRHQESATELDRLTKETEDLLNIPRSRRVKPATHRSTTPSTL